MQREIVDFWNGLNGSERSIILTVAAMVGFLLIILVDVCMTSPTKPGPISFIIQHLLLR